MNRFLATSLGSANALFAILLILAGPIVGWQMGEMAGAVLGILGGLSAAVLICGFLALLVNIRDVLESILHALEKDTPED